MRFLTTCGLPKNQEEQQEDKLTNTKKKFSKSKSYFFATFIEKLVRSHIFPYPYFPCLWSYFPQNFLSHIFSPGHGVENHRIRSHTTLRAKRATLKKTTNTKNWLVLANFGKHEACGQTVILEKSVLIGQKLARNIQKTHFE